MGKHRGQLAIIECGSGGAGHDDRRRSTRDTVGGSFGGLDHHHVGLTGAMTDQPHSPSVLVRASTHSQHGGGQPHTDDRDRHRNRRSDREQRDLRRNPGISAHRALQAGQAGRGNHAGMSPVAYHFDDDHHRSRHPGTHHSADRTQPCHHPKARGVSAAGHCPQQRRRRDEHRHAVQQQANHNADHCFVPLASRRRTERRRSDSSAPICSTKCCSTNSGLPPPSRASLINRALCCSRDRVGQYR